MVPYLADLGYQNDAGTSSSSNLSGWMVNRNDDMAVWQLAFGVSSQYQSYTFATEYNPSAPPNLIINNYTKSYVESESNGNSSAISGGAASSFQRCSLNTNSATATPVRVVTHHLRDRQTQ